MRDATNNHRDYRIARKFWVGITGVKNPVRDPRLSFGELELTFLTFHFSCLPSKRSFGSCPRDDPILRLRREATMRRNRNSRYFVYLKTLGTEKLVWLQVKTLYLALDTLSRFLLWICDTFSFSF